MSKIIKDEATGEDVEVFTKDELEAQAAARAEAERKRVESEKQAEIDAAAEEKAELEEKLRKEKEKEKNFEQLRKQQAKEKQQDEAKEQEFTKIRQELDELKAQPIKTRTEEFIRNNIGADTNLKEKFEFFFKKLGDGVTDPAELEKALNGALTLANDGKKPVSSGVSPTGVNDDFAALGNERETEGSRQIGNALGLSEADKQKYQPGKVDLFKVNPKTQEK